eukprot:jgi/Orpsp1_1/1180576/evm.model.c7180000073960.1
MKTIIQRVFTTILTAISVSASYIPASSGDENSSNSNNINIYKTSNYILNPSNYNINPHTHLNALLPSSFDLRDVDGMNFISPVKDQGYWGICWAFSGMAAAEASAQYELWNEYGISPDELSLDFSELQLGWFAYTALQEDETDYPAQKGEGNYFDDDINKLDVGGTRYLAITLMASGVGPFNEGEIPYISKSGNTIWVKVDENGKWVRDEKGNPTKEIHPLNWKGPSDFKPYSLAYLGEDWSVDLKKRFNSKLRLEHAYSLPSPAVYDENMHYHFDQVGLDAIKQELNLGRAVDIEYFANTDNFDSLENPPIYLSRNYAHYTYKEYTLNNHEVTIVGYDDDYPVSKFLQVDSEGNNIAPPANGAFICKNSWGSKNDQYVLEREFGVNGTGYFYLSYYDKSIGKPTSYDFSLVELELTLNENEEGVLRTIDQHDLIPTLEGYHVFEVNDVVAMSNVFTPGRDEVLDGISTYVFVPNIIVDYEVYKLNTNHTNPVDGTLVASGTQSINYAGFHLFDLKEPVQIASTESYSIVVRQKDKEGNHYYGFSKAY